MKIEEVVTDIAESVAVTEPQAAQERTIESDIAARFFAALDLLIEEKRIRGYQTFTSAHGIHRTNLNVIMRNPESLALRPCMLSWLCTDYGISPRWLLTGDGEIYSEEEMERTAERRAEAVIRHQRRYEIVAQLKALVAQL